MSSDRRAAYDRVLDRRRAVGLARHFREAEGLSIAQTADRLGRSPATIKAYFYDPTGEKARGGEGALRRPLPRLRRLSLRLRVECWFEDGAEVEMRGALRSPMALSAYE